METLEADATAEVAYSGLYQDNRGFQFPDPTVTGDILEAALRFKTYPCCTITMLIDQSLLVPLLPLPDYADDLALKLELAKRTQFTALDDCLVYRETGAGGRWQGGRRFAEMDRILDHHESVYRDYPAIRREVIAERAAEYGLYLLERDGWSLQALRAFRRAARAADSNSAHHRLQQLAALGGETGTATARRTREEITRWVREWYWESGFPMGNGPAPKHVLTYRSIGIDADPRSISVAEFRRHLAWLKRTHRIQDVPTLHAARAPTVPLVAITVEEGLGSLCRHGLPAFRELDVEATVLLIGGMFARSSASRERILEERLQTTERFLTKREIRELAADPRITFGSHTRSHPSLSSLESEAIRDEIVGGRDAVADAVGDRMDIFAYPCDRTTERVCKIAQEEVVFALGDTRDGIRVCEETPPHAIPRVDASIPLSQLKQTLMHRSPVERFVNA